VSSRFERREGQKKEKDPKGRLRLSDFIFPVLSHREKGREGPYQLLKEEKKKKGGEMNGKGGKGGKTSDQPH